MSSGMLADNADDGHTCFAGVMKISKTICQTRSEMQQCGGWPPVRAGIAVRRSRTDALEEAQNAAHFRHAIERSDEVHFRRSRIQETGLDAIDEERVKNYLCTGGHFTNYARQL